MAFVCHPRKKCAFHSKMCSSELSRRRVSKGKWPWRIRRAAMRRILAQARIELIQLSRDRLSLVFVFALPLILLITFGSGLSLSVSHLPIIVQDLDGSTVSRQFADAFRASNSLYIISWPTDRQPEDAFTLDEARAAIIIPAHFERDVLRRRTAPVQMLADRKSTRLNFSHVE